MRSPRNEEQQIRQFMALPAGATPSRVTPWKNCHAGLLTHSSGVPHPFWERPHPSCELPHPSGSPSSPFLRASSPSPEGFLTLPASFVALCKHSLGLHRRFRSSPERCVPALYESVASAEVAGISAELPARGPVEVVPGWGWVRSASPAPRAAHRRGAVGEVLEGPAPRKWARRSEVATKSRLARNLKEPCCRVRARRQLI